MLPELKVKIGAETASLENAIDRVKGTLGDMQGAIDNASRKMKSFGDSTFDLGKRMLPLSGIVSGAGVALFGLGVSASNAGDKIDKGAKRAGLSAEAYQELGFAIGQVSDLTNEQLGSALEALQRRMGEAAAGNAALVESFEKVGISAEEIASGAVTTEDAFMALANAAGSFSSDAEASSVAADLLGRSGAALGPILRESGNDIAALRDRAKELGIVLSDDAVAASASFSDQMDEATRQLGNMKNELGIALLPVMSSLVTVLQDSVVPALLTVIDGVTQAIDWFGQLPDGVQAAAGIIAGAFAVGGPALMAIGSAVSVIGSLAALFSPAGLIIGGLIAVAAAWAKWGDDIKAFSADAFDWVVEKAQQFLDFYLSIPGKMFEIGRNVIVGLWDGLKSAWDEFDILGTIGGWASGIGDRFKSALGIQSPSTVFHEFGMNIGEGLRNGIEGSFGMVKSAVAGLGDQVTGGAWEMATGVVDAMGQMFKGSKPIAMAQALINTFQGITEALKLPFPANLSAAAKVAVQGFQAVKGIQSAKPGASGGAASAQSGASATPAAQAAPQTQRFILDGQNASGGASMGSLEAFADMVNKAARAGYLAQIEIRGV